MRFQKQARKGIPTRREWQNKSQWKICAFLWLETFGQEMMKLHISEKGVCFGVTEVQVSAWRSGRASLELQCGIERRKWPRPAFFPTPAAPPGLILHIRLFLSWIWNQVPSAGLRTHHSLRDRLSFTSVWGWLAEGELHRPCPQPAIDFSPFRN